MGRKKIQITRIVDERNRQVSVFSGCFLTGFWESRQAAFLSFTPLKGRNESVQIRKSRFLAELCLGLLGVRAPDETAACALPSRLRGQLSRQSVRVGVVL